MKPSLLLGMIITGKNPEADPGALERQGQNQKPRVAMGHAGFRVFTQALA